MTKLLRLSDSSWPRSRDDLQATYPLTAFPVDPATMAAADLAEFDHCVPVPTSAPIPGPSERVEEVHPVLLAGQWCQAWELVAISTPPPPPDWERFRSQLQTHNGFPAAWTTILQGDSRAAIMLIASLSVWQAAPDQWGQFLAAVLACLELLPLQQRAEVGLELLALAHSCHLDPAFLTALEALLEGNAGQ